MKSLDVMTLMGQDTGLAASYNKPTVDMLLSEYLKAVDNLTIYKSTQGEEIVKNQAELAEQMQIKEKELSQLREQIKKISEVAERNYKSYDNLVEEVYQKAKQHIDGYRKEEDERRRVLYDMLDKQLPEWREKLGFGKPLTPEVLKKMEGWLKILETKEKEKLLNIHPPDYIEVED